MSFQMHQTKTEPVDTLRIISLKMSELHAQSQLPPCSPFSVELIKTRSQWYPPLMKEMFLSHSSLLGNRWLGFVQMFNILTKTPLKVTLEECRPYRFKFQTVPGNRRSKSKKTFRQCSVRLWESWTTWRQQSTPKPACYFLWARKIKETKGKKSDSNSQLWNNWPSHLWSCR